MIVYGNPVGKNQTLITKIKSIVVKEIVDESFLRDKALSLIEENDKVLDCGRSLRDRYSLLVKRGINIDTLDLNVFENYPDIQVDICDSKSMKNLANKYDFVICFSLIEHCYDPFLASSNLFKSLRRGGKIIGSAPFLFPHHGPEDLSYQDYFRFTRDSYALLFPDAHKITLYPLRGRLGTTLVIFSLRYRFDFEARFPKFSRWLNQKISKGRNRIQTSGFGFIIEK